MLYDRANTLVAHGKPLRRRPPPSDGASWSPRWPARGIMPRDSSVRAIRYSCLPLAGLLLVVSCSGPGSPARRNEPEEQLASAPQPLLAGSASAVITPSVPVYLAGSALGRRSTGVHDDLYARCLVISNGELSIGLVVLDLVGFFYPDVEAIRAELGHELDHVIVAATHNHSGPDVLGLWGPAFLGLVPVFTGRDEAYVGDVRAKVIGCLRSARTRLERVALRLSTRVVGGFSENIRKAGVKDDELTVMEVRTRDSRATVAVLYNFAAHPEIFLEDTVITADFPYFVNRRLHGHFGGQPIFVNG